ncbi:hypothetical protein [Kitasatospora sp. GP82]|uniref:hypothetical protein n=1 Tax=Kitasatospora sp. GP82 TaxID=3035089 RepID=UPI002476C026|nr:hypothetical protein [Kitasatospora sp. GP82]MDH6130048.1 hypothetical protein [Kitasatospora sp. GP82]
MAKTTEDRAVWLELNDRQRFYLESVYRADQRAEAQHRADGATGVWDDRPASVWRQIKAYHEPPLKDLVGTTELQYLWERAGYHSQGNGSTIAMLVRRGLVLHDWRATRFGRMHTLAMTRQGRAVVRAGLGLSTPRSVKLSERSVEVIGLLYAARSSEKGYLDWGFSRTVERFIEAKPEPLARYRQGYGSGYEITDAGIALYERSFEDFGRAYPRLVLPDPAGRTSPWPADADRLLEQLANTEHALRYTIKDLRERLQQSEKAAADTPPQSSGVPAKLESDWHDLLVRQARERADLARTLLDQALPALDRAVVAYAAATLAAVTALVEGRDVLAAMTAAAEQAEPGTLPPFTPTGVDRVDLEAKRLHDLYTGQPKRRGRGRAPRVATGWAGLGLNSDVHGTAHEVPLALAKHLASQLREGYLQRRLDQAAHPAPAKPRRPRHLLDASALKLLTTLAHASEETDDRYHEARRQAAEYNPDYDRAAVPPGLLACQAREVTRSSKAVDTLLGRDLIERTDVAALLRYPDDQSPLPERAWYVYSITETGRAHLREHRTEYEQFHPDIPVPTVSDDGPR